MANLISQIRQRSLNRQPSIQYGGADQMENAGRMPRQNSIPGLYKPLRDDRSMYMDEMNRLSQPGPGMSQYRQALQEMPQAADYEPNWLTRIAAGMSGFSEGLKDAGEGIQVAQGLNRSGYMNALGDYQNRLGTLQEQADMEQQDRRDRLANLWKAQEMGLKYDEFNLKRDDTLAENAARDKNAEAAMISANARAAQAAKANYDYIPVQGGFMVVDKANPANRQTIKAATVQDAQNAVARQNANTAAENASINRARLPIQQQQADAATRNAATSAHRESREALLDPVRVGVQVQNAGEISPKEQEDAASVADQELMLDRRYSRFYGNQPWYYGKDPLGPSDFTPEEWQNFQEERADKIQEILNRRR